MRAQSFECLIPVGDDHLNKIARCDSGSRGEKDAEFQFTDPNVVFGSEIGQQSFLFAVEEFERSGLRHALPYLDNFHQQLFFVSRELLSGTFGHGLWIYD